MNRRYYKKGLIDTLSKKNRELKIDLAKTAELFEAAGKDNEALRAEVERLSNVTITSIDEVDHAEQWMLRAQKAEAELAVLQHEVQWFGLILNEAHEKVQVRQRSSGDWQLTIIPTIGMVKVFTGDTFYETLLSDGEEFLKDEFPLPEESSAEAKLAELREACLQLAKDWHGDRPHSPHKQLRCLLDGEDHNNG